MYTTVSCLGFIGLHPFVAHSHRSQEVVAFPEGGGRSSSVPGKMAVANDIGEYAEHQSINH